ncbi:glycoside hydrolase domain-containing protein [Niabella sp. CJ426]|uniref:glycoside hydrolase domain-containing protein n=1 Tax=Niabella sp. CJ426 TaxID=3393740 RepID=UPI003D04281C
MRAICDQFYGTEGIHGYGFGQDEDQGQLGAWFVMAAMGLFDVKGFTAPETSLGLSGPLFNQIRIRLNSQYYPGKDFTIIAKNIEGGDQYIQAISLNGQPVRQPFIPWAEMKKGGVLQLQMGHTMKDVY